MKNLQRAAGSPDMSLAMPAADATDQHEGGPPRLGLLGLIPGGVCALWCCYSLNGFRGWWVPITVSDADAGAAVRQVLFLGSAMAVAGALWITGTVWNTVRTHWRFGLLAAWLMATVTYSESPTVTLKRAVLFACGAVATAGMMSLVRDPLRFVSRALTFIPAAAAWVSLAWWLAFPASITTNPARPGLAGISNHPNTLGPALAFGLIMAIGLWPTSRAEQVARALSIVGCALGLAMTTSMTSIGFGVFGVAVFFALVLPTYWRALAILAAAGTIGSSMIAGAGAIGESMLNSVGRDSSLSGRDELWNEVMRRIAEAPAFGRGWGAFWLEGRGRELVSTWNPRQSHNAYLDVLLDLGIVGALICLLTLGPSLWFALQRWRFSPDPPERRAVAALLAATAGLFLVYALQQSFVGKVDTFAFFAVLLSAAALSAQRNKKPSPDDHHPDPA